MWKHEIIRILQIAMGKPGSGTELAVLLIFAIVAFTAVMSKVGDVLKIPMATTKTSVIVLAVGGSAMLIVIAAVNFYVMPHITGAGIRKFVLVVSIIAVLLAIAAPATCLIQRATYLNGLSSILLSIAASFAVVLLVRAGISAFMAGDKELEITRVRKDAVNEFLGE